MAEQTTFTLTDIARLLGTKQHRLIHLCEKEVVHPDLHDAAGRGSSREFSNRNLLEFALALRLRDIMLPLAAVRAILYVLRAFEGALQRDLPDFSLPESLRARRSPDLRIVVSDGETIYFSLTEHGKSKSKLFGGIPLGRLIEAPTPVRGAARTVPAQETAAGYLGSEGSRYARLEVSVTRVARDLPLD